MAEIHEMPNDGGTSKTGLIGPAQPPFLPYPGMLAAQRPLQRHRAPYQSHRQNADDAWNLEGTDQLLLLHSRALSGKGIFSTLLQDIAV